MLNREDLDRLTLLLMTAMVDQFRSSSVRMTLEVLDGVKSELGEMDALLAKLYAMRAALG